MSKAREILFGAKVVFWDFDGVVKDSVAVKTEAFAQLFGVYGDKVVQQVREHHECNGGVSRFVKMPLYLAWADQPTDPQNVQEFCNRFSQLVLQAVIEAPWVPGVREYLHANAQAQRFVLVTATPQDEVETILAAIGLRSCFEEVYGAPTSKSTAIRSVLERWHCRADACLMIGDTEADCAAARDNQVLFMLRRTELNRGMQTSFTGPSFDDLTHE